MIARLAEFLAAAMERGELRTAPPAVAPLSSSPLSLVTCSYVWRWGSIRPHRSSKTRWPPPASTCFFGVRAVISPWISGPAGVHETIDARYVVGCDGATSTTRKLLGIELEDLSFDESWLVVDVLANDRGLANLPANSAQYCEPARPSSYPIGMGRHLRRATRRISNHRFSVKICAKESATSPILRGSSWQRTRVSRILNRSTSCSIATRSNGALVTVDSSHHHQRLPSGIDVVDLGTDAEVETDDVVHIWMTSHGCSSVLVRPDHYVFGSARSVADIEDLLHEWSTSTAALPNPRQKKAPPTVSSLRT